MLDAHKRAAAHWSTKQQIPTRLRWWQSPQIVRHINRKVCGEAIDGMSAGAYRLLAQHGPFKRGVSIGCGAGRKELTLIRSGAVRNFDLFELSATRIDEGRALYAEAGLSGRVTFHESASLPTIKADLVHWNNALHHMLDVHAAVQWSREVLADGGVFFMDDYIGPNRLQWTAGMISAASAFRNTLPENLLRDPRDRTRLLSRTVHPTNLDKLIEGDPTEAADSESIVPALINQFPALDLTLTGGVIYHAALADILHNIDEESPFLAQALALDDKYTSAGLVHYAVALATV